MRHLEDVSSPDQVSTPEQSEHEGDEDEGEGEEQLLEALVRKKRDIDAANEAMRSRVDAEMAGVMANGVTPNPHLCNIHGVTPEASTSQDAEREQRRQRRSSTTARM